MDPAVHCPCPEHRGALKRIINSHTALGEAADPAAELQLQKHVELSSSGENCLNVCLGLGAYQTRDRDFFYGQIVMGQEGKVLNCQRAGSDGLLGRNCSL